MTRTPALQAPRLLTKAEAAPFLVCCKPCDHVWALAYLPMDMGKMVKLMKRAACPRCGNGGKTIFLATAEQERRFSHAAALSNLATEGA
jgi:ribosomal protein S27AE